MLLNLILLRKRLAMDARINHQRMVPPAIPAVRVNISKIDRVSLATFMAAMMAMNRKIAMGLDSVSRKTEAKSCERGVLFKRWSLSCFTGFV